MRVQIIQATRYNVVQDIRSATVGRPKRVAGDELGHLVGMTYCCTADDQVEQGYLVKKGDNIRLDANYWEKPRMCGVS